MNGMHGRWAWMVAVVAISGFVGLAPLAAGEQGEPAEQGGVDALLGQVKDNPNDVQLLDRYFSDRFGKVAAGVGSDAEAAERQLAEIEALLEEIEPTEAEAGQLIVHARAAVDHYSRQLQLQRVTLEELLEQAREKPGDVETITLLTSKLVHDIQAAGGDVAEAQRRLDRGRAVLDELDEATEATEVRVQLRGARQSLAQLEQTLARGRRLEEELVGKPAVPLEAEAWVNGEPLLDDELNGKVVVLDFWAVWCGPCIATFPHLREWQEEYADRGMVLIGVTRYYNYRWNDEAGRAQRSEDPVPADEEQRMLEKFARQHDLYHRIAVQPDREYWDYYGVSGIPHVVVIDQHGQVRLVRVGSGQANARDIQQMIEQLLAAAT